MSGQAVHGAPVPCYQADVYSDSFIADPLPHYAAMRGLGPVVWLPAHGNYALPRYAEAKAALSNASVFVSGEGVAADETGCRFMKGNTLASDEPRHQEMRTVVALTLTPRALAAFKGQIQSAADALVRDLVARKRFDGVADLARHLPLKVVTELVGLPEEGRSNMLRWADAGFNILGIQNARGKAGIEVVEEMRHYIRHDATPEKVKPGSWVDRIYRLAQAGDIPDALCPSLIRDYIGPSLDTTIAATAQLVWQLGRNPGQWARLKADKALVPRAVEEAVRLATPIRSLARHVAADHELAGTVLPAGARVMILYASANRDERVFPDPDRFDLDRTGPKHVGFGYGPHACVGMHLARMEMTALLDAMLDQVTSLSTGPPKPAYNNTIAAMSALPVRFD